MLHSEARSARVAIYDTTQFIRRDDDLLRDRDVDGILLLASLSGAGRP